MSVMQHAMQNVGLIDTSLILKQEFLRVFRLDPSLRSIFQGRNRVEGDNPRSIKTRKKKATDFLIWMHKYNNAELGVTLYKIPEHKMPVELFEFTQAFGYRGSDNFIGPWNFVVELLHREGVLDMEHQDIPEDIGFLIGATVRFVEHIFDSKEKHEKEDITLHLKQLLGAIGGDISGINLTNEGARDFIIKRIRRRLNIVTNEDGMNLEALELINKILSELRK